MSCQRSRLTQPHMVLAAFATLPFLFVAQAWAAPHSHFVKRDSSTGGGSKIVAPIIAALVFLVAIPMVFYRNTLLSKLRRVSLNPMRRRPATTTTVRDLTAEEIAGTAATNQANAAATTRTERRARRTRRTPSQISTRSLPAYMKEPGEHELVIIQGLQDMEDAPLTAQVVMPSLAEDDDESANSHSRNTSQASSYVIVNDDPHVQTPLLQTNESNEFTHEPENSENSNPPIPSRTVDIAELRYDDPSSPPSDNNVGFADPRGEAPPYFEVVGNLSDVRAASEDLARVDTTDTLPIAPDTLPTSSAGTPPVRRRSMFRGLIDAASRALSSPHPLAQPVPLSRPSRDIGVASSPRPSNLSNRPNGTRSPHVGHRATQSNGSVLSVTSSAFRTRSRSVTNVAGGLTSPSALSITSISAPLTHTAVRTDFVYPRSGPTPDQLKLISSVESVSKFGVPYGPDAVAYASVSLVNLQGPPPEFEERPSSDNLPGPSTAATRVRPTSGLSRLSQDGNALDSRPSISYPQFASMGTADTSASATNESEAAVFHPEPDTNSHTTILGDGASASELEPSEDKKEEKEDHRVKTVPPRAPSSPTVDTTTVTAIVTEATASELSPVPESPDDSATPVSHRPLVPFLGSEPMTAAAATRKPTAPSSFRMPSTPLGHTHTASRSSSIDTFRTAVSRLEQGRGSERETSDTEHDADTFSDAESGTESGSGTPPVTPHAASIRSTVLIPEPPALSV